MGSCSIGRAAPRSSSRWLTPPAARCFARSIPAHCRGASWRARTTDCCASWCAGRHLRTPSHEARRAVASDARATRAARPIVRPAGSVGRATRLRTKGYEAARAWAGRCQSAGMLPRDPGRGGTFARGLDHAADDELLDGATLVDFEGHDVVTVRAQRAADRQGADLSSGLHRECDRLEPHLDAGDQAQPFLAGGLDRVKCRLPEGSRLPEHPHLDQARRRATGGAPVRPETAAPRGGGR